MFHIDPFFDDEALEENLEEQPDMASVSYAGAR
jgi:hypothetical protein